MNVLVTGGTGFLGAYVMAALEAAGHAPFAYDVAPPSPEMLARRAVAGVALPARARSATSRACSRSAAARRSTRSSMRPAWSGWSRRWRSRSRPIRPTSWGWCMPARWRASSACASWSRSPAMPPITRARASSLRRDRSAVLGDGRQSGRRITAPRRWRAKRSAWPMRRSRRSISLALRITAIYGFGMRRPMYIKPMVENAVRGRADALCDRRADEARLHPCARLLSTRSCCALERAAARRRRAARAQRRGRQGLHTAAEVAATVRKIIPGADDRDRRHADAARSRERQDARAARHRGGASACSAGRRNGRCAGGIRQYARTLFARISGDDAEPEVSAHPRPLRHKRTVACDGTLRLTHSRQQNSGRMTNADCRARAAGALGLAATSAASAQAPKLEKTRIALSVGGSISQMNKVAYFVALNRKYFEQEGLDGRIRPPSPPERRRCRT